ncbi:MAG: hypothetical protein ACTSPQ_16895, partial [Candidatus Helarchaeota archaeon]
MEEKFVLDVYSVYVLKNGVPLFHWIKDNDIDSIKNEEDKQKDTVLVSGFLSAIVSFANEIGFGETRSYLTEDRKFSFLSKNNFLFVISVSRSVDDKNAFEFLERMSDIFINLYDVGDFHNISAINMESFKDRLIILMKKFQIEETETEERMGNEELEVTLEDELENSLESESEGDPEVELEKVMNDEINEFPNEMMNNIAENNDLESRNIVKNEFSEHKFSKAISESTVDEAYSIKNVISINNNISEEDFNSDEILMKECADKTESSYIQNTMDNGLQNIELTLLENNGLEILNQNKEETNNIDEMKAQIKSFSGEIMEKELKEEEEMEMEMNKADTKDETEDNLNEETNKETEKEPEGEAKEEPEGEAKEEPNEDRVKELYKQLVPKCYIDIDKSKH